MEGYSPEQEIAERSGLYPADPDAPIRFEVVALAQRRAYGRTDYWISPRCGGEGGKWVAAQSVIWNQEQQQEGG